MNAVIRGFRNLKKKHAQSFNGFRLRLLRPLVLLGVLEEFLCNQPWDMHRRTRSYTPFNQVGRSEQHLPQAAPAQLGHYSSRGVNRCGWIQNKQTRNDKSKVFLLETNSIVSSVFFFFFFFSVWAPDFVIDEIHAVNVGGRESSFSLLSGWRGAESMRGMQIIQPASTERPSVPPRGSLTKPKRRTHWICSAPKCNANSTLCILNRYHLLRENIRGPFAAWRLLTRHLSSIPNKHKKSCHL